MLYQPQVTSIVLMDATLGIIQNYRFLNGNERIPTNEPHP